MGSDPDYPLTPLPKSIVCFAHESFASDRANLIVGRHSADSSQSHNREDSVAKRPSRKALPADTQLIREDRESLRESLNRRRLRGAGGKLIQHEGSTRYPGSPQIPLGSIASHPLWRRGVCFHGASLHEE